MRTITVYDSSLNETASYTLENHGIPYFNHTYSCQIEDTDNGRLWEDTNSFSVLNEYKPAADKNACMYFDWTGPDGRIYRYAITNIADQSGQSSSGVLPYTSFTGTNKLAYDLSGIDIEDKSWVSPTLRQVAEYVLGSSGWSIGECDSLGINTDDPTDFAISGASSAQDALSTMVTSFGCEIRAYIEVDKYGNITQTVDIVKHLQPIVGSNYATTTDQSTDLYTDTESKTVQNGNDTTQGRTIEYRAGLAGFERQEDRTAFYTRLYPTGKDNVTIQAVNNNSPYVVDQEAQDYWLGVKQPYRTLKLNNEHIKNKSGLMTWAKSQLKIYNHPAFTYTITTAFMEPDDMPLLGTTNLIANFDVQPTLTVLAEVIQVEIHDDAPTNNVVTYGEFRTLNPTTPAFIDQLRASLASAIARARADASSVKPVSLTPDGNNFSSTGQTKRLILQAWEGSVNISAFIDSKGFIWRKLNTDGTFASDYQMTGYYQEAPYSAIGTLHGTIETGYIQDDPERSLDPTGITHIGDFNPIDTKLDVNKAVQYMCKLSNGQYITSRAINKKTTMDTRYVLHNSDFSAVSAMTITNGGHGASFSIEEADGNVYIWASTCVDMGSKSYAISRFPYVPGGTLAATDGRITHYCTVGKYCRVNVDFEHGYLLCGYNDGTQDALKLQDVRNGNYNVIYTFNITNYGFKIGTGTSKQTYQSQVLDFPYVYWQSGNVDMHDARMVYGVNIIHKGEEFAMDYLQDMDLGMTDKAIEPETCNLIYDSKGNQQLLVTFNCLDAAGDETERVYTIPIKARASAAEINTGVMEE